MHAAVNTNIKSSKFSFPFQFDDKTDPPMKCIRQGAWHLGISPDAVSDKVSWGGLCVYTVMTLDSDLLIYMALHLHPSFAHSPPPQ